MLNKYIVTLRSGGRVQGVSISEAESSHMHKCIEQLLNEFPNAVISINANLGMLTMQLTPTLAEQLKRHALVYSVHETKVYKSQAVVQSEAGWALARLCNSAYNTYFYTSSGKGVTIYIVDSGVDSTHSEFTGRLRKLFNTDLAPYGSHGTHVAGLAAGVKSGVAKDAQLVDVQATDDGLFLTTTLIDAIDAIIADTVPGRKVVNFSLGGEAQDVLDWAIEAMISLGIIVVASAGNDAVDVATISPARVADVITVAATDQNDLLASFSNFGTGVDTLAPGVDVVSAVQGGGFSKMSGTSMAAPLISGLVARYLELCPEAELAQVKSILPQTAVPNSEFTVRTVGASVITPLTNGKVRAWWLDGNGNTVYGPWTSVAEAYATRILQRNPGQGSKIVSVVSTQPDVVPAATPTVIPAAGATIGTTVDPDEVYSYSLQLSYASGTFSYAGILAAAPNVGQLVDVQGLNGTVQRVGPSMSRSEPGTVIDGRILPLFSNELIAVRFPARQTGAPYLVSELVAAIAAKAGTEVTFLGTDIKLTSFEFSGRFTDALNQLAANACAVLLQQNGSWYIVPVDTAIGSYNITEHIVSCKQQYQADILDQAIGLFEDYRQAAADLGDAKRALSRLNNTGEQDYGSDQTSVTPEELRVPLGAIAFDFGTKNRAFKSLDAVMTLEGGYWDEWADGATGKESNYYQVLAAPNRGCRSLDQASILVEVKEPSNSSGLYYARGILTNLRTVFWTGDESNWGPISPTYRTVRVNDKDEVRMYFEFRIIPTAEMQYYANKETPIRVDKQQYICNLDLAYIPTTAVSLLFNGTIHKLENPILAGSKILATVPVNGGNVRSATGASLWQYDSSQRKFYSQTGTLLASLVGNSVVGVNGRVYGTLSTDYTISSDKSLLIGRISAGGDIVDHIGNSLGSYIEPRWQASVGTIKNGMSIMGAVYGGDSDTPRVMINSPIPGIGADDLLLTAEADRLVAEKAAAVNLTEVLAAKLACLERALTRLKVNLGPLRAAVQAWEAYNAAVDRTRYMEAGSLAPSTTELAQLELVAQTATDSAVEALNSSSAKLLVTELTALYNNKLPLPGNRLAVPGIAVPDSGIVQSVNCTFSSGSCTLAIVSHLWT